MTYCLNRKVYKLQSVLSKISLIVTLKISFFDNTFISRQNSEEGLLGQIKLYDSASFDTNLRSLVQSITKL